MKRRNFLIGAGGTAIGGSALLGSGAFSRVESDRVVNIEVAEDPDAYLGLDECDTLHGDNYVDLDGKGHLKVDIGNNPNGGEGVNSNSRTWLDSVFQICNQGKEAAGVWLDADPKETKYGEDAVKFYRGDDRDRRVDNEDDPVVLDVGECICVGIQTTTHGFSDGEDLLEDDGEITIYADVDVSGEPAMPAEDWVTVGRVRDGGTGWQVAVADPTGDGIHEDIADNDDTTSWDPQEGEDYSFEFTFDGAGEYSLTVEDADGDVMTSASASGLGVAESGSQFQLTVVGNEAAPVEVTDAELNDLSLGDLADDDESWPSVTAATEDLSQAFSVSGDFVFQGIDAGERPAIHIQIEEQDE